MKNSEGESTLSEDQKTITITSYNIHKGMSPLNRQVVTKQIGEALRAVGPDILCLQEVQGKHLKREIKFNEYPNESQHEWFGEFLDLQESYGKNSEYDEGHHGNAVLSRHSLDPKHNVNITVNKLEQRGVLHCEVTPKGWDVPVTILCAHLNLREGDRQKQYELICEYVNEKVDSNAPLILAGDFNDWKRISPKKISEKLNMDEVFMSRYGKMQPTFPARLPVLSLDRIYVRNLAVKRAWVHKGKPWSHLSDHLPVSAQLALDMG